MKQMQRIELLRHYKNKTALVLDDFPNIRTMVKGMLESAGVSKVDTVASAEDAIKLCEKKHYDMILTDYNLGEKKNGQQLLEEIRHKGLFRYSNIYMMITAETTRDKVYNAIEHQPDAYMSKPFTSPELRKRLDAIMVSRIDLAQINKAADEEDIDRAIALCKERISKKDRYMMLCQKLLGIFLHQQQKYDEAETLYEGVLEQRELLWALIGLGRVYLATNQLAKAKKIFFGLVAQKTHFLEAYDALAQVYEKEGMYFNAQQVLEQANYLAPDAVLRQMQMAKFAQVNGDFELAEKAYRHVIKVGYHSIYEAPDNYLSFVKCLSNNAMRIDGEDKKRFPESREILARLNRRYRNNELVTTQAGLVDVQALWANDKKNDAKANMDQYEHEYFHLVEQGEATLTLTLDYAKALETVGERDKAVICLEKALTRYGQNTDNRQAIDSCLIEPISDSGKDDLKRFNKEGKVLFETKQFEKAVIFFDKALYLYPHNLALNINMAMALIRLFEQKSPEPHQLQRLKAVLVKLNGIKRGHNYYAIYVTIQEQAEPFFAT